jgi:hypothetical protein
MYLLLDGTAQSAPKRCSGVQIVSTSRTGDKRMSVREFMRIADARQIEIVMRHATFISTLRESHLPFQDDYSNRPHTILNEAHPTEFESRQMRP